MPGRVGELRVDLRCPGWDEAAARLGERGDIDLGAAVLPGFEHRQVPERPEGE